MHPSEDPWGHAGDVGHPYCFRGGGDPVGTGVVASLARPGGNVTGLSMQQTDLAAPAPSARRRPASLGSVKSEASVDEFAPVTDANVLDYSAPMDREMLKHHLAQAEKHIATGDKNIARQRDLIAQLERDSHDMAFARAFLREFERWRAK